MRLMFWPRENSAGCDLRWERRREKERKEGKKKKTERRCLKHLIEASRMKLCADRYVERSTIAEIRISNYTLNPLWLYLSLSLSLSSSFRLFPSFPSFPFLLLSLSFFLFLLVLFCAIVARLTLHSTGGHYRLLAYGAFLLESSSRFIYFMEWKG